MTRTEPRPKRVLIVDDETDVRTQIATQLSMEGFEPLQAANGAAALGLIRQGVPAVVLLDVVMPGHDALQVLREVRRIDAGTPVVLLAAHGSLRAAVEAVKAGAYDYVGKPLDRDELILAVRRAIDSRQLRQENQQLRAQMAGCQPLRERLGTSEAVARVCAEVQRVAATDFAVVLTGEPGLGKELAARAVHQHSARANGPFIAVDCGTIAANRLDCELFGHEPGAYPGADRSRPGKFEAASGGTLFLDAVHELPPAVQGRVLRALQDRHICHVNGSAAIRIDVRMIVAAPMDLAAQAAVGAFRQDLYQRLSEFTIHLPPLRERRDDVIFLAKCFLDQTRDELRKDVVGIAPAALDALLAHPWPGNARELRNVIRRAVLLAERVIEPEHLGLRPVQPAAAAGIAVFDDKLTFRDMVRRNLVQVEREFLQQALKHTNGNKAKAARMLQIDYKTIHTKAKEYGLSSRREEADLGQTPLPPYRKAKLTADEEVE